MDEILAKSDGTTLIEHITDCLGVYSQLVTTLPLLPEVTYLKNFWDLLFSTVYMHDWGKSHKEFQKVLKGIKPNFWNNQRHEAYSVPFVDKLNFSEKEKLLLKRAILGHHKDFLELSYKIIEKEDLEFEFENEWKNKRSYKRNYHPEDFVENLRHLLNVEYLKFLVSKFNFFYHQYTKSRESFVFKTVDLKKQKNPFREIAKPTHRTEFLPEKEDYWGNFLLWGATKICDHYGSAKIKDIKKLENGNFYFLDRFQKTLIKKGDNFYKHQKDCFQHEGNCILIAPTGSGKTEAAIGWLRKQLLKHQGRSFYILPYTASINAMHKRLSKYFLGDTNSNTFVGIQHGKLTQYLATYFEEETYTKLDNIKKNKKIEKIRDLHKKMIYPLKIATPFQILKFCYGVKGFEMGFTEIVGANLILDEIHAYDEITFAQIIVSLQFFIRYLHCRVIVMTATLPTFMLNELKKVLQIKEPIKACSKLLEDFNRHKIQIMEGCIFVQLDRIRNYIQKGERVLVVCNTVSNSQKMYTGINSISGLSEKDAILLHSRFISKDRKKKEEMALSNKTKILIGTQAIEVSLDIDYDVLFTEPAPLDALLQRFGRTNRKRRKYVSPVYVCNVGGENDHYIYKKSIVDRTLKLLKKLDIIREDELQNYLDFVYPDWEREQKVKFEDTKLSFEQSLRSLQPYSSYKENEEEFYERFDGIQVLPACFLNKYKNLIDNYDFIEAENYLVTIQRGIYFKFKNNGQIEQYCFEIEKPNGDFEIKYVIVAKCKYDSKIGLTYNFEDIDDIDRRFI
ncbi:MAG: CRISPR-associated helicase Cas3' [Promethearchaeota archaeon]